MTQCITIRIAVKNDALHEDLHGEVWSILHRLPIDRVLDQLADDDRSEFPLRDSNGNRCGHVVLEYREGI